MEFNTERNSTLILLLIVLVVNLANIITASAQAYVAIKKANRRKQQLANQNCFNIHVRGLSGRNW